MQMYRNNSLEIYANRRMENREPAPSDIMQWMNEIKKSKGVTGRIGLEKKLRLGWTHKSCKRGSADNLDYKSR
jgi:hypothetical protein